MNSQVSTDPAQAHTHTHHHCAVILLYSCAELLKVNA